MPSFTNRLGAVSRRGQWRFRETFRAQRADGRIDTTDEGLIDFSTVSSAVLTVSPRLPLRVALGCAETAFNRGECPGEPAPVLSAAFPNGALRLISPGLAEAVFPAGSLIAFPRGLYDVRLVITVADETEEVFAEPIEFT